MGQNLDCMGNEYLVQVERLSTQQVPVSCMNSRWTSLEARIWARYPTGSFYLHGVVGKVTQVCLTLCDPMDIHTVHGILQARILECTAIPPSPGDLPKSDIEPRSPALHVDFFNQLSHQGSPHLHEAAQS